ncbi:MAG: 2,3-bisphosphoglycerate-independent phosphoglycerate mutase [Candidatus Pacebacteria bacterium]|nr:2,3-bisphosphoglycerate-independent phosphoglycerate mutase [Candidatus Paceibacterota bacterium]
MGTEENKNVVLIILDGWGYREDKKDNAIAAANTPVFDFLWKKYPHTLLEASGLAVGLPPGQMGNSEVGHTTIGAGTTVDTDLVRIKKNIDSGEFAKNEAFISLFDHVKKNNSMLHVQGLVSDGGVHSHFEHLLAFLRAAKENGIKDVAIHVFTDGRDVAPQSASGYIKKLEEEIGKIGIGFITSISGRFYAMDRDNNWDRLEKVEQALFECKGNVCTIKPSLYLENLYKEGKIDELLEPIVCHGDKKGCAIEPHDGIFFFNFRADRARMMTKKLIEKTEGEKDVEIVTLTDYDSRFEGKVSVAFPSVKIETTLAKEISNAGLTQAHIAETEKFPHATYFLNGGVETPHKNESHILLESRKDVPTHNLAPKMRAEGIADKAIEEIEKGTNFIFINFANADMVGHTADVPAIIEAVEETDKQLGRVIDALQKKDGVAFITADHGNAELNIDQETGTKHTSHTINLVPAILTNEKYTLKKGGLSDITPTILKIFGIKKPDIMKGESLV